MAIRKEGTGTKTRYRVYVWDSVNHRNRYVGTFARQKDAVEAEAEARRRLRWGEPLRPKPAPEDVSLAVVMKRWYDGLVSVRKTTRLDYDKAIRRLRPLIGSKPVSALTRKDIDKVIAELSEHYAASTVRKTVVILKMVLRMALEHGNLDRLPFGQTRLALPRTHRRTFEPLNPAQVKLLIESTPEYWQPFVRLLLTTGLRRGEAWGLRIHDVDLDAGVVHVRGQLVHGKLVDLKTDAAYRDVPLPRQTVVALREHLERVPDSELGLLFPTPEGKPADPSNWYARVWIPARDKAGLPGFRMHDCRHHVASVYLSQGRSITYVQRLLGHSSPMTLLSIYSWVTKGEAEVATSEFEKWLGEEARMRYGRAQLVG